jgi:cardiolipin synthase (CMP-forming)
VRCQSVSRGGGVRGARVGFAESLGESCAASFADSFGPATLVAVRVNRTGVVAGSAYLLLGVAWAVVSGQPAWILWFVAVAVIGAFIPGEANQVSLARAYLAAPALAYAMRGSFGALAVVVAVAGLTDLVDGTVARRLARPSNFGGGLDPVVDGLLTGGLVIGLAIGGTLPLWLALVVVARYFLPALAGGVLLAVGRRPELRHTLMGQVSTVLILVLVGGVCLFRALQQDSSGLLNAAEVVIPVATVATFVHLALALRRRPARAVEGG